jgi:hypothetical protein
MHWWIAQQVAEEHRRDLAASARIGVQRAAERDDRVLWAEAAVGLGDRVATRPTREVVPPRRAIVPSVGALLIRLGTRLGGASMRPS